MKMNFRFLTVVVALSALILFGYILMTRRQEGHTFDQLKSVGRQNSVNRLFAAKKAGKQKVFQHKIIRTKEINGSSTKAAAKNVGKLKFFFSRENAAAKDNKDQLKAVRPQNVNPLFAAENAGKLKVVQPENAATEEMKENDNRFVKLTSKNADDEILRYVAVNNSSLIGEEFNFDVPTKIMLQNVLRNQTFKRKPVSIDPKASFFNTVVPVTGASSNHYKEFMLNIKHFASNFPGIKVIFYDLGLENSQVSRVKSLPFVNYRKLNFDYYPSHVRNLHTYAWKPLIIQQILTDFDGVMWFDTSVKFQANTDHVLERMARVKSGILFYVGTTGHSILAATNPGMLKYFPMTTADAVTDMFQASAMIILNTEDVQKHIMKWLCVCAFKQECIAPPGSQLYCGPSVRQRDKYAGCHRFDQALINILAKNLYGAEDERYSLSGEEEFAIMNRM